MSDPKTPEYTRKAIRAYEKNLVRKSVTFDVRKPDDMALLEMIEQDGRAFAEIARTALLEHLQK
ncbi:hypothetical protein AAX06_01950 [Moraxella bovoculi]|uniref:Uncharacterized protein n=1 Tax=Moraxella bovoculi TaxID=386891 RepID=A0AAC8PUD9_9GAMM|nr:hypothetical protein [Moraxella bovoculi]AKG07140.1 hypothetical protein AAX06_01950 [Moraxella bovoculi]AKG12176.1 hypothetical protein AAX07_09550 [Moraxella bovoculi]AKG14145.1 hypothetical protein AAX11_09095 [Moraxella bovoculi]